MAHQHASSQDLGSPGLLLGEQRISRRTILRKLAGLTLAGGSIASFATSCGYHTTSSPASQNPRSSFLGAALYTYRGHSASVNAAAWSPDGTRIASGSADGTVQVWDAANGGHVFTYRRHVGRVNAVAWSPDGTRIASGSADFTVQVWDAANGGHAFTYRGHADHVNKVPWSPDGKRIASGSDDDTVQVWDAANGGHIFTYRGHADAVWGVAWSSDGTRIVSGSGNIDNGRGDKTAQVWGAQ